MRRCDAWLRIRKIYEDRRRLLQLTDETVGRIFMNYVNRSVVVQILSGHEVKYRVRIIKGLRTREWGWVYDQ